jgi:hypothetical protein
MTVEPPGPKEPVEEDQPRESEAGESDPTTQSPTDDSVDQPTGLPKDVLFGLLSARRRRRVLEYMRAHGGETTLSDLADHIAAQENDTEIRLLTSQQRKRVYVALYQCHLPKMDDANVIEFDQARGTVRLRPEAQELAPYLELDPTDASRSLDRNGAGDESENAFSKLRSLLSR